MHRTLPIMMTSIVAAVPALADTTAGASSARVYVGPAVHMTYGPVRVTITVVGTRMTRVTATAPLDKPRSRQINQHAVPILDREALTSQKVRQIHKVSGASLTTVAFEASLANAMGKANLPGA